MSNRRRVTVYSQSSASKMATGVSALVTMLVGAGVLVRRGPDASSVLVFIGLSIVVAGVLFVLFRRQATVADATGLVVTGFFTTLTVPWARIQAIVIESSGIRRGLYFDEFAIAYLDTGRGMRLRGVDNRNLAGMNLRLPTVVESLRKRWIARRGSAWHPIDAVQVKAAEMARYHVSARTRGTQAFLLALPATILFAAAPVFLNISYDDVLSVPLVLGLVLGGPPMVGVVVWITSTLLRRRARGDVAPPGATQSVWAK